MGRPDSPKHDKRVFRAMTPANIRQPREADYVEVVFLESARFYRLLKSNPMHEHIVTMLRDAIAKKRALLIRCTSPESDTIAEVQDRDSPSPP
jgi:hypothetical protein